MTEERRLPPARVPRAEDVDAEELQERDGDRDSGPQDEPSQHDGQVRGAPDEERHRDREQAVLDELEEAHEVLVEERVVERDRAERLEREPREERRSAIHSQRAARSCETPVRAAARREGDDDEDGEVGEPDVDRRRARAHAQVGLVALVEEEERDRAREDERAERSAIYDGAEPGGGVRAVRRLRRHRATIGRGPAADLSERRPPYTDPPMSSRLSGAGRHGRLDLRRRRVRHRRDDRRGPRPRPRRVRRLRNRDGRRRLLPGAARPHRRGVAHEVRVPVRRRPTTGGACGGSSGRRSC